MNYSDTIEQSSEHLRLVLKALGQYELPADPLNYRLWYDHITGVNAELSQALQNLIVNQEPITAEVCRSLYARHISESNKLAIENVRSRVQQILAEVIKQVLATGSDVTHYNAKLANFTEQLLIDGANPSVLKNLIDELLNETRTMANANSGFQSSLTSISNEVEALKHDLEQARHQATTDALTGLANRRAFDTALVNHTTAVNGSGRELALLMVDIDLFKRINDSYGHLAGDKVLIATANLIKSCADELAFVARFGGEEFVVLLPDTDLRDAHKLAEKIRLCFEMLDWSKHHIRNDVPLTLSIGIANYASGESLESFIQRADLALYSCKNSGRNQVTICSA